MAIASTTPGRGKQKRYVYTYPAKKALASIVDKVRALTRRRHTNPSLESPTAPAQPGASRLDQLLRVQRARTVGSKEVGPDELIV